jgi:hypothetical protein
VILRPVERGRTEPVLPGKRDAVTDAHPSLFGAVHKEETAERPEGLAAEALLTLLVEDDHLEPSSRRLRRRDKASEPRTDHQQIAIHHRASRRKRKLTRTCA